jgi:hypothetical protein
VVTLGADLEDAASLRKDAVRPLLTAQENRAREGLKEVLTAQSVSVRLLKYSDDVNALSEMSLAEYLILVTSCRAACPEAQ